MAVTLLSGTHKFHLGHSGFPTLPVDLHLRRTEVLEHRQMRPATEFLLQSLSHVDSTSHDHHIDVFRRTFQENVTHVASHHVTFHAEFVSRFRNQMKDVLIKYFCQLSVAVKYHIA